MNDELLPCPFCGMDVDINDGDAVYPLNRDRDIWQCGCTDLDCCASVLGDNKEHAIRLWNSRV